MSKPLNIAEVFFKYPPAIGGHERYVQWLSEGLSDAGHIVDVFTSDLLNHRSGAVLEGAATETTVRGGVRVHRLGARRPVSRGVCIPGLRDALVRARPDVIHAHDIWRDSTEVAVDVCREYGIPLILNPVFHDRSSEPEADRWQRRLDGLMSRLPSRHLVLFNTPWELGAMRARGWDIARHDYLPPAIPLAEIDSINPVPVPGIGKSDILLLFLGRLTREKGLPELLAAFGQLLSDLGAQDRELASRLRLAVAGFADGPDDYEEFARLEGYDRNVVFHVNASRSRVVSLLKRAAVLVLPSRVETYGIVVLEAWACDTLVLAARAGALPHVVSHGRNGMLFDIGALRAALGEVLPGLDSRRFGDMRRAGRRTVEDGHTIESQVARFLGFADSLL